MKPLWVAAILGIGVYALSKSAPTSSVTGPPRLIPSKTYHLKLIGTRKAGMFGALGWAGTTITITPGTNQFEVTAQWNGIQTDPSDLAAFVPAGLQLVSITGPSLP